MSSSKQTLIKNSANIKDTGTIHESDIHMAYEFTAIAFVVLLIYFFSYLWEWLSTKLDCCVQCDDTDSTTTQSNV